MKKKQQNTIYKILNICSKILRDYTLKTLKTLINKNEKKKIIRKL